MKRSRPGVPFDARSLVGRWTAAVGTFAMVMDEEWRFDADGTGAAWLASTLGDEVELPFEWEALELGALRIRSRDDGPEDWVRLDVVTGPVATDGGTRQAIWTPPSEAFWMGIFPLARA